MARSATKVADKAIEHPYIAGPVIGFAAGAIIAGGVIATGGTIACGIVCGGAAVSAAPVIAGAANQASQSIQKWPHPEDGRAMINGVEYSQHALGRMMPNGMQWADKAGKIIEGRGVPPSAVQNAIEHGSQATSYGDSVIYSYENVQVVRNIVTGVVRTIIRLGH